MGMTTKKQKRNKRNSATKCYKQMTKFTKLKLPAEIGRQLN